jgi:hypothetical protein
VNENSTGPRKKKAIRGALFLVMGAALAVGTWSIYTLLTVMFHAPWQIAVFGSGMFDIAALYFALLAQSYATSEDSGLAPRLAMLAMVSASTWTNWTHAHLEGWGTVGGILLGSAPGIAEIAFEMWHRFEHREALRQQGRVQASLPVIPGLAWLFFPKKSFTVTRTAVEARLDRIEGDAAYFASPDAPHAERITASPAAALAASHDDAQHIVITLQQPRQIAPSPQPRRAPATPDAPTVYTRQNRDAAPRIITVPQAASPDAHTSDGLEAPHDIDLTALSKAAAVRAMRDAHPDAQAQQIADALAPHGITVNANYVRTVLSRASSTDPQQGTGGYL